MVVAPAHPAFAADVDDFDRDPDVFPVRFLDRADDVQIAGGAGVGGDADVAEDPGVLERALERNGEAVRLGPAQLRPDAFLPVVVGVFGKSRVEHRDDDIEPLAPVGDRGRGGGRVDTGADRRPRRPPHAGTAGQHRQDGGEEEGATRIPAHRRPPPPLREAV